MAAGFTPKQVTQYEASHLIELQGECSEIVVDSVLQAIPEIAPGSKVHDNACGTGVVFQRIFQKEPKANIKVAAPDVNEFFVAGAAQSAKEHGWPVTTAVMPSQKLDFSDSHFTHSFTNFAFHCLGDSDRAASEIHRTLKPGGTAAATIWIDMPFANALLKAHHALRGKDAPPPVHLAQLWYGESDLRRNLERGGFQPGNIKCFEKVAYLTHPDLRRWVQLAWSYLGAPPTGWTPEDELNWDKALQTTIDYLEQEPGYSVNEKGEIVMKMRAVVAIATK